MVYRKTAGVLSRSHGLCVFIYLTTMKKKKNDRFALHAIRRCIYIIICDDDRLNLYIYIYSNNKEKYST